MRLERTFLLAVLSVAVCDAQDPNLDRFNYDTTKGTDFGPLDWNQVSCSNFETCLGWPEEFRAAPGWSLNRNHCRHCPPGRCGTHHQSPIDLRRHKAIESHPEFNECFDGHWMAYHDSGCTFDDLTRHRQFTIERYGLRIGQPLRTSGDRNRLACRIPRWGRIDFPKGFSSWFFLSHTEIHLPSEHTQEGKTYDGELQMYHFFSEPFEETGVHNEMGTVSIFLQVYPNSLDQPWLNRVICGWRREEELVRRECGLPSIDTEYPGCFPYSNGQDSTAQTQARNGGRKLRTRNETFEANPPTFRRSTSFNSFQDLLMHNLQMMQGGFNKSHTPELVEMDEEDFAEKDFDFEAFIEAHAKENHQDPKVAQEHQKRHLLNYEHIPWFNYWPLLAVRTEYYYRYAGTQTIPPCYGTFISDPTQNRRQSNHWRVMKDPIRISQRQLDEMNRLIRERIAPQGTPLSSCQPDTGSKPNTFPDDPGKVNVARPIMGTRTAHFKVYCECNDWRNSRWPEDQEYCKKGFRERFYEHPYNFDSGGEF